MVFKHEFYIGLKDINYKQQLKNKSMLEFLENILIQKEEPETSKKNGLFY